MKTFTILGNNTAGLKAKKDSLEALIQTLKNPSCIMLQETKLDQKMSSKFKITKYFKRIEMYMGEGY